jgi:hypothetical protein
LPIHTTQQVPRRSSRRTVAGKPRRPILLAKSSAECRREKAGPRIQVSPEMMGGADCWDSVALSSTGGGVTGRAACRGIADVTAETAALPKDSLDGIEVNRAGASTRSAVRMARVCEDAPSFRGPPTTPLSGAGTPGGVLWLTPAEDRLAMGRPARYRIPNKGATCLLGRVRFSGEGPACFSSGGVVLRRYRGSARGCQTGAHAATFHAG